MQLHFLMQQHLQLPCSFVAATTADSGLRQSLVLTLARFGAQAALKFRYVAAPASADSRCFNVAVAASLYIFSWLVSRTRYFTCRIDIKMLALKTSLLCVQLF